MARLATGIGLFILGRDADAAQKAFEDDLDSSDVIGITQATTAAYKDWHGYDDLLGPQGAQAYSEVEAAEF